MNVRKLILSVLAISAIMFFNACEEDACKDVTCLNAGTCVDGDCICAPGYEGTTCEIKMVDKFVGTYKLNENCPSGSITDWPTSIDASNTTINKILITGFGGFDCAGTAIVVEATVNGKDITIVANQSFCGGDLVINSGSGSMNATNTAITITYSYTLSGSSETCTGTYTKQ
ncbi:MAG: hypothetical protein KatS3mg031_0715 [Chitinophagales bacterium]|nr:MAG: hypothetical protein KatS3mg031_0715 [Chitinophagales bacterium]